MNLKNKKQREALYKKLAEVLRKHRLTLPQLLRNPSAVDRILGDVEKEIGLNKVQLQELIEYIDQNTSLGVPDRKFTLPGEGKRLPDLNDYDHRRNAQTRARYGKWSKD